MPLLSETTPWQKNVARFGLEDKPSIYLPPLHLKFGLGGKKCESDG